MGRDNLGLDEVDEGGDVEFGRVDAVAALGEAEAGEVGRVDGALIAESVEERLHFARGGGGVYAVEEQQGARRLRVIQVVRDLTGGGAVKGATGGGDGFGEGNGMVDGELAPGDCGRA